MPNAGIQVCPICGRACSCEHQESWHGGPPAACRVAKTVARDVLCRQAGRQAGRQASAAVIRDALRTSGGRGGGRCVGRAHHEVHSVLVPHTCNGEVHSVLVSHTCNGGIALTPAMTRCTVSWSLTPAMTALQAGQGGGGMGVGHPKHARASAGAIWRQLPDTVRCPGRVGMAALWAGSGAQRELSSPTGVRGAGWEACIAHAGDAASRGHDMLCLPRLAHEQAAYEVRAKQSVLARGVPCPVKVRPLIGGHVGSEHGLVHDQAKPCPTRLGTWVPACTVLNRRGPARPMPQSHAPLARALPAMQPCTRGSSAACTGTCPARTCLAYHAAMHPWKQRCLHGHMPRSHVPCLPCSHAPVEAAPPARAHAPLSRAVPTMQPCTRGSSAAQ